MTSGRPCPSQTACSLEFRPPPPAFQRCCAWPEPWQAPPLVRPIRRGTFPFSKGWRPCGAPSNASRRSSAGRACRPWPPGLHPQPAPADEAIVDRLVRTIVVRRIAPAQTVADHENNPRDHPPVIDPWHPVRQRKIRLNPAHLRLEEPNQISHDSASSRRH